MIENLPSWSSWLAVALIVTDADSVTLSLVEWCSTDTKEEASIGFDKFAVSIFTQSGGHP
jgi:hypothetical protein